MNTVYTIIVSILSIILSFFIRRDPKKIVFGAWCGELYADNSKYLAQYINRGFPQYKIYWVGSESIREQIPSEYIFVRHNSLKSVLILNNVKYFFFTQMHRADICKYNVYRNAKLCYLDHGYGVKKWGADDPSYKGKFESSNLIRRIYHMIIGESTKYDYIISPSEIISENLVTALRYRISDTTKIILSGSPRDDYLVHANSDVISNCKTALGKEYDFSPDKIIVSYLPTFRRKTNKVESLVNRDEIEIKKLVDLLDKYHAVLLEKNHFAANKFSENLKEALGRNLVKINKPSDFQDLLLASDIQIGDYSGGCLDFLLLNRPIIYYMYDYNEYKNYDSGLYWEAETFAAGPIVGSFDELLTALEEALSGIDKYSNKRMEVKSFFMRYEDGHCCERICREVLANSESEEL